MPPCPQTAATSWIEISRSAFEKNVEIFRSILGPVRLWPVLKANAYGHGLRETSDLLADRVDGFAVFDLDEAQTIKARHPSVPVLVLGPIHPETIPDAARLGVSLTAASLMGLKAMADSRETLLLHLKIETGTNRQGIRPDDLEAAIGMVKANSNLRVDGVYTHFANIEDTTDHGFAMAQLDRFRTQIERLDRLGMKPPILHTACSAAALLFPEALFSLARIGISIYGLWPSPQTKVSFRHRFPQREIPMLTPALAWKARIMQTRRVPEGEYIGYGCAYRTMRPLRVGVLSVGYCDGYDRGLSNQAFALVKGRRAPVRGKICMNMTVVDLTDIPEAQAGDEAILIGEQNGDRVSVEDLASLTGTINYEVVSRIGAHLPRVVV